MASKQNNRDLFHKLSSLFKGGPIIRKKIRTLDTVMAQADKTKSSGALLFQKSMSPTYATITSNAYNLSERLMRYQDFCFGADTLVYTLDGGIPIKELATKYPHGERFFVYSYDYESKCPVVGTAFFPRIVNDGILSKRLRVTFDDGGHLDLTPDHKVILRDGSTKQASDLSIGESLMPLYVSDINNFGYKWVYMLGKSRAKSGWLQEHVFVAEHFHGKVPPQHCVHHVDFDRTNNRPENLVIMPRHEHQKYHAQLNNKNKLGKPSQSHSHWMQQYWKNKGIVSFNDIVDACIYLQSKDLGQICAHLLTTDYLVKKRIKRFGFSNWSDFVSRFDLAQSIATNNSICFESRTPELQEILDLIPITNSLDELASRLCCTRNAVNRRLIANNLGTWSELKNGTSYSGKKKGPAYSGPSYKEICDAYCTGMTCQELATTLATTFNKVSTCIKNNGHYSYTEWSENFRNHKVTSITPIEDDVVYTITVEKYHNLAVGSISPKYASDNKRQYSMIFATQCEMEQTPEIGAALDIYASETCAQDERGRILHVYSDNERIREILEDLFYNILNVEFNLTPWVRNLVKYGDMFTLLDVSPEYGIINTFPIPVNEIEREENYDKNDPFACRFRWVSLGNRTLENWEVAHFRLLNSDTFLPYGSSVIESARRIWRQLILIEDAMLVYRVTRAPERRVFYIDVGNLPPDDVPAYVEAQRRNLRTSQVMDRTTGRSDVRYNPMPVHANTPVPLLDGRTMSISEISQAMAKDDSWVPWVYSIQDGTNKLVPGKVVWCGKNYTATELVKVWLDDGSYVTTAPEHPFILRNGEQKRADELDAGNKLMPFYRKDDGNVFEPNDIPCNNHEIVRIERLTVPGNDVYCMTVVGNNGEDDRHNFAICGLKTSQDGATSIAQVDGIFVKNSVDEDFILPIRGGESGTKIETLPGGQNVGTVEDVAYIQKKLFAALKIPRAYLGYDDMLSSKASLAQLDIRFSRTITAIQKTVIAELNKMAVIHLFAHGYESDDLLNFTLRMSNPSTVAQQQKLELWRAKFEIAGNAPEGMSSKQFIRTEIWGLNQEQIDEIETQRLREKLIDSKIENANAEGSGEEEAPEAGGEEELPPETASEEPPEEDIPGAELLLSSDEDDVPLELLKYEDDELPVRKAKKLKGLEKYQYNNNRKRTHGASKTHMPDLNKMTGTDSESMRDPYSMNWLKSVATNPLGENVISHHVRPRLSSDTVNKLSKMEQKLGIRSKIVNNAMLTEGKDIQDEIDYANGVIEFGEDNAFNQDDQLLIVNANGETTRKD